MFDTIQHRHGSDYPQTVIHKHAPTTEAMALLREMQHEVARDFAETHAPQNELLNIETWRRAEDRRITYSFKLNGKLYHGAVREDELMFVSRHAIADALFTAIVRSLSALSHPAPVTAEQENK